MVAPKEGGRRSEWKEDKSWKCSNRALFYLNVTIKHHVHIDSPAEMKPQAQINGGMSSKYALGIYLGHELMALWVDGGAWGMVTEDGVSDAQSVSSKRGGYYGHHRVFEKKGARKEREVKPCHSFYFFCFWQSQAICNERREKCGLASIVTEK